MRRSSRPSWLTLVALVPLATLAMGSRYTPSAEVIDSGTYTLYLRGERVGDERFIIREDRGGEAGPIYRTRAQLTLKLQNRTMRIEVGFEGSGPKCRLRRYEAEINGTEATTLVAVARGDRIALDVRSPGGHEMKEYLVRGATAVLDLNIAHHYFFALRLLGSETSTTAYVLTPRERTHEQVTITDRGSASTQVAGRALQLRHITLTTAGGTVHHIWARDDRVMKVEVPALQFRAERSADDVGAGSGAP